MTRADLSEILSAKMRTRTILEEGYTGEISDDSQVSFIELDELGILVIKCLPSEDLEFKKKCNHLKNWGVNPKDFTKEQIEKIYKATLNNK